MSYFGVYAGVVSTTDDPEHLGRLRAQVPALLGGTLTHWARPCTSPSLRGDLPVVGDGVWVMFEAGELDRPVWLGVWSKVGQGGPEGANGLTGVVDVSRWLTDPTDPTTTVSELEALGAALWANGGGTLYFSPGDYYLDGIEQPASGDPWWFRVAPPYYLSPFDRGGIRLRNRVNLSGAPGARLVWSASAANSACMIGADDPFDDSASALLTASVDKGDTTFSVDIDPTDHYEVGDDVQIRLGQVPGDTRECAWWAFAKVTAVTDDTITLDAPAEVSLDLGEMFQQAYIGAPTGDPSVEFTGHAYDHVDEVADSFGRSDSALTLGNTDTGETWQRLSFGAGKVGISSGRAYPAVLDVGANIAYLNIGETDQHVKMDVTHANAAGTVSVLSRFNHSTISGFAVPFGGTQLSLLRLDAGVVAATLGSHSPVGGLPSVCKVAVVWEGDEVRVYLNGVLVISATDSTHSGTEVGFNLNHTGAYIDNFTAGTPIWPNYRAAWIRRFLPGRFVENVTVSGFELVREGGRDSNNSPQSGIMVHRARGVTVKDIHGSNTGTALVTFLETEGCHLENCHIEEAYDVDPPTGYYGGGFSWAASKRATGTRVSVRNTQYGGLNTEQASGDVFLEHVLLELGNPERNLASHSAVSCFNGHRTTINRLEVRNGPGGAPLFYAPGLGDRLSVTDLIYSCDSADGLDFGYVRGRLRLRTEIGGTPVDASYRLRVWQGTFPILNTGDYTYRTPIPDGPIHRAVIYASDLTGVESVAIISDPSGIAGAYLWEADLSPAELQEGQSVLLGRPFGGGQALSLGGTAIADDMSGREIRVIGSGTVAGGQWGTITLEYFAPDFAALGEVTYQPDTNQEEGPDLASVIDVASLKDTLGYIGGW